MSIRPILRLKSLYIFGFTNYFYFSIFQSYAFFRVPTNIRFSIEAMVKEVADIVFLERNGQYHVKDNDITLHASSLRYCDKTFEVTGSYESDMGCCVLCLARVSF